MYGLPDSMQMRSRSPRWSLALCSLGMFGLLALVALPVGCGGDSGEADRPGEAAGAGTETSEVAGMDTGLTGVLSEEAFQALHELRGDQAPPAAGEMIDLAGTRAYLSLPPGATGSVPGIVVIHEWWGLNDNIKHWSDRLAAAGYAALAVDLYGGTVATTSEEAMATMKTVDEAEALEVLQAAHAFLANDPRIRAPRRAVVGWCFGGGYSLQLALHAPDLDAAVIYYGRLITDPEQLGQIEASLLGIFGNKDQGIPPAVVNDFEAALSTAGVEHQIRRYDAEHAFGNPSSARYDQKAAGQAWKEVQAFLAANLEPEG